MLGPGVLGLVLAALLGGAGGWLGARLSWTLPDLVLWPLTLGLALLALLEIPLMLVALRRLEGVPRGMVRGLALAFVAFAGVYGGGILLLGGAPWLGWGVVGTGLVRLGGALWAENRRKG